MFLKCSIAALTCALSVAIAGVGVRAENLQGAMAKAYANNPALQSARAALKITDENVPQALSGWRPSLSVSSTAGKDYSDTDPGPIRELTPLSGSVQVVQPLFSGGGTIAATQRAEADVLASRAGLDAAEQDVLLAAVTVYVDMIRDEANLELTRKNEEVLEQEQIATKERFDVGEVTKTDVAQSEARLARATANRISAEGALAVSAASYERVIGEPPVALEDVPDLPPLPKNLRDAIDRAIDNNPIIAQARFNEESAKHGTRVALANILPTVDLVGSLQSSDETALADIRTKGASVSLRTTIPLYQSGSVHSLVRQAKQTRNQRRIQIELARRQIVEQTTQAWQGLSTTRSNLLARQKEIEANEVALEGVKMEATVGARTILDVLDAEQELLDARVAFIVAKRDEYVAAYQLISAIGDLRAAQLQLPTKLYDPTVHYDKVKYRWIGLTIDD